MSISNLDKLAVLIGREKETLLSQWRAQVRQLPSAKDLDTPTLNDHVPALLDELACAFRQVFRAELHQLRNHRLELDVCLRLRHGERHYQRQGKRRDQDFQGQRLSQRLHAFEEAVTTVTALFPLHLPADTCPAALSAF